MRAASNANPAERVRHAARSRRRRGNARVSTALLCAVALVCAGGVVWRILPRIGEWNALASLRAALDAPADNVVVIRMKQTPTPDIRPALPMPARTCTPTPASTHSPSPSPSAKPTPSPSPSPSPTPAPSPTPKPDSEMSQMQARMDNLRTLQAKNSELTGWITIPDTRIDYPVMWSPARTWYYLDHNFDGKSSKSGLPFLDEKCDPGNRHNLLIYGHNMKDGSMFAGLHKLTNKDYYEAHRTLYYITPKETARYTIVAVALVEVTEDSPCPFYLYTSIDSKSEYDEYVRIIKKASRYGDDMDAVYGDELITLCTCAKHATPERLIVVAKRTA